MLEFILRNALRKVVCVRRSPTSIRAGSLDAPVDRGVSRRAAPLCLAALALIPACSPQTKPLTRHEFSHLAMGVRINAVVYASDERSAREPVAAAFAEISRLDQLLSDYRPESQLSLVNARAGQGADLGITEIDPAFADVLRDSLVVAERTDGAFDPSVGPVVQLWRAARKSQRLPDPAELAAAVACVGWQDIELAGIADHPTLTLRKPRMKLDPGAFVKGYAAQRAVRLLRARGIDHAMIAIAGDISCSLPPPGQQGWRIAVSHGGSSPDRAFTLLLRDQSVSTAGDTEQFVEIDGKRYSHIVDPRTGLGLTNRAAATVVSRNATTADSLDTGLCVAGLDRFGAIMAKFPDCEARLETLSPDGTLTSKETPGFRALIVRDPSHELAATSPIPRPR